MRENIVTGKKYRILIDDISNIWDRISFWTKASDVELNNGTTVESAISTINTNISTINTSVTNLNKNTAPKFHADSDASKYGKGTTSAFGHLKISDDYTVSGSTVDAAAGVAASIAAVYSAWTSIRDLANTKAPKDHAAKTGSGSAMDTPYGKATTSLFGHVRLSDSASSNDASLGIAATPLAVQYVKDEVDKKAPKNHAAKTGSGSAIDTPYGKATTSLYGHVLLSDSASDRDASLGYAASPYAVQKVIDNNLTANSNKFVFAYDSTSKKYGYKLNGSGTFYPFNDPDSFPVAVGIHSYDKAADYTTTKSFTLPKGTYRFDGITKNQSGYSVNVVFTGGGHTYRYNSGTTGETIDFHYNQFTLSSDTSCTLKIENPHSNIGMSFAIGYVYRVS